VATRAGVVGRPDLVFTTRDELSASRCSAIELETWEGDRSIDLGRRPVAILRADRWTSTASIVVHFADPPRPGAAIHQPLHVGHAALVHERIDDVPVRAVQPDQQHAPPFSCRRPAHGLAR
jgi:hypothetical protein